MRGAQSAGERWGCGVSGLEPDLKYGYEYMKQIKAAFGGK
jgi:hypothetical protein